jgi:tyrosine aminotransferase
MCLMLYQFKMVFTTEKSYKKIEITEYARLSVNPLRKLTFESKVVPNPDKKTITLQLGDPTAFGNFPPPKELVNAFRKAVDNDTFLYNPNAGRFEAREAVAKYSQNRGEITADDIVLTSGCNHALEFCIWTLTRPGENVLIPAPCYTYKPVTDGSGIISNYYKLDPSKDWEIDLKEMESLINEKTRAIVVNHPGNPCGNVFTKEHILDILAIAERHQLPIISDEIYEFMVFPGVDFHPIASLSKNVPVLTCSGLTKRFSVPGIRMGWIIISDRNGALVDVKEGLRNCTGRILGPNSTVQFALPEILQNTPQKYFDENMKVMSVSVEEN